jgi:endonuclease/exonuclease/phosphatase family metal-dependent hydrolase
MMKPNPAGRILRAAFPLLPIVAAFLSSVVAQDPFRVVTYNVENYLVRPTETRKIKPEPSRAMVVKALVALKPDVLALQEIGDVDSLAELQGRLKAAGLNLPHAEHVRGYDTNIFVAVLSRFPIVSKHPHTNESYLLNGRRFRTSRAIAEVEIEPRPGYRFSLLTTHLKSKRAVADGDEAEMRTQEAMILREKLDALLQQKTDANFVVCGDFNDTRDTPAIRAVMGRGNKSLMDTRPAERNGDTAPSENPNWDPRRVTWTHYYGKEDSYSRLDYILVSRGMAREWRKEGTYILTLPDWGVASDHRPLVAEFLPVDK